MSYNHFNWGRGEGETWSIKGNRVIVFRTLRRCKGPTSGADKTIVWRKGREISTFLFIYPIKLDWVWNASPFVLGPRKSYSVISLIHWSRTWGLKERRRCIFFFWIFQASDSDIYEDIAEFLRMSQNKSPLFFNFLPLSCQFSSQWRQSKLWAIMGMHWNHGIEKTKRVEE